MFFDANITYVFSEEVGGDFEMEVSVYSCLVGSGMFSGSASLRLKNRLKGSFTRSLGHKWGSLMVIYVVQSLSFDFTPIPD